MNGHFMRLATASLFHVNIGHLISNVIGLIIFMSILELTVERYRTLLVVLLSGIGGEVGSIILQIVPWTVGASSIVFGVYGALGVVLLFHRRGLKRLFWVLALIWIINFAFMNIIGYISLRYVDHGAHVGGILTGILTAASVMHRDSSTGLRSPSKITKIFAVALCVVFIIAFATEAIVFWP
jgi:rhomboid protease GluP